MSPSFLFKIHSLPFCYSNSAATKSRLQFIAYELLPLLFLDYDFDQLTMSKRLWRLQFRRRVGSEKRGDIGDFFLPFFFSMPLSVTSLFYSTPLIRLTIYQKLDIEKVIHLGRYPHFCHIIRHNFR